MTKLINDATDEITQTDVTSGNSRGANRSNAIDHPVPSRRRWLNRAVAPLVVAASAAITAFAVWNVNSRLDVPRLEAKLLRVEVSNPDTMELTAIDVLGVEEFLADVDAQARLSSVQRQMAAISKDAGGIHTLSGTHRAEMESAAKQVISLKIADVREAIAAARAFVPKIEAAVKEIDHAMALSKGGTDEDKARLRTTFEKIDGNPDFFARTPISPEDSDPYSKWFEAVQKARAALRDQASIIQLTCATLEKEMTKAMKLVSERQTIEVTILINNHGNKPAGLMDVGLVKAETQIRTQLVLQSKLPLGQLVIPANGHQVIVFSAHKSNSSNAADWPKALEQLNSTNATCIAKLQTTYDETIATPTFPFHPADTFKANLLDKLRGSE